MAGVEHDHAGEDDGREREHDAEKREPGEPEPEARQSTERERDGEPCDERRSRHDGREDDHGTKR